MNGNERKDRNNEKTFESADTNKKRTGSGWSSSFDGDDADDGEWMNNRKLLWNLSVFFYRTHTHT